VSLYRLVPRKKDGFALWDPNYNGIPECTPAKGEVIKSYM